MAEKKVSQHPGKTPETHPLIALNLSDPLDYTQASDALVSLVSRKLDEDERKAFVYLVNRLRHFAEKERGINAALWLSAEEWETVKQHWFGLEALISLAEVSDELATGPLVTLLRKISADFVTLCCNELDSRTWEHGTKPEGGDQ